MKIGFRFQVSSFRFQVSGFRFQVSGFKFQVSGFRFQVGESPQSTVHSLQFTGKKFFDRISGLTGLNGYKQLREVLPRRIRINTN